MGKESSRLLCVGLLVAGVVSCKTTGDKVSDVSSSSASNEVAKIIDPLIPCGSELVVNPIDFGKEPTTSLLKFAAAVSFGAPKELLIEAAPAAQKPETWMLLLPKVPEIEESIFNIRPHINISFIGVPKIGVAYPVVDDCFEPREGNSPLTVCGDSPVQSGTVTYLGFPDTRVGGPVLVEFDLQNEDGQTFKGVASSCLTQASLNPGRAN